ncbi:MAG: hypothetical protein IAG13_36450 [Deltaproteobacteria bacterium]|nr:hypothetical protein [Nannocystaceae bacterium]
MSRCHGTLVVAIVAGACIVPDRDIRIDPGIDNEGAVRIVERAPRLDEMDDICNIEPEENADPRYCPEVPDISHPSGLLGAKEGKFCVCPAGSRDNRAASAFKILAEDTDPNGPSSDTLYGVALLDPETRDEVLDARAYTQYWGPGFPGEPIDVEDDEVNNRVAGPVGRRRGELWLFEFDDGNAAGAYEPTIDLCNDNDGDKLSPGMHNLRFMVSDREYFTPTKDAVDAPATPQPGIPDLAAGATYATIDYVFECVDPNDPEVKAHDDEVRRLNMLDPDDPQRGDDEIPALYCSCSGVGP